MSRYASALASATVPTLFGGVFAEYWQAFQARQAAVQASTQEAYGVFMTTLQEIWDQEEVKSRLNEACRSFGSAVQEAARSFESAGADGEPAEEAYREYVGEVQRIWNEPEVMEQIEQALLTFTESVQQADESARETFEAAQKNFVRGLYNGWVSTAEPSALDEAAVGAISKSMAATVFFTEGVQPPDE